MARNELGAVWEEDKYLEVVGTQASFSSLVHSWLGTGPTCRQKVTDAAFGRQGESSSFGFRP